MYRLFVDEVGHSDIKSSHDPDQRHLSLTGIVFPLEYHDSTVSTALANLKVAIFGNPAIVLHRREISRALPPFTALRDSATRERFDDGFLLLVGDLDYRAITVVIDKKEHRERYSTWLFHPYHYCMMVLLERYVMYLETISAVGDVMVESRQRVDNQKLSSSYGYFYHNGTEYIGRERFQRRLTTKELKIKDKDANVPGLQFADLLAHPSFRACYCSRHGIEMTARFGSVVARRMDPKYLKSPSGSNWGWGWKWLP